MLFEPANPLGLQNLRNLQDAAEPLGIAIEPVGVQSADSLDEVLQSALLNHPQALISQGGVIIPPHHSTIVDFAVRHGLPTASDQPSSAALGGLIYYGPDLVSLDRRSGNYYVDRILRGAKPADIPVEGPTVFGLTVNRTTAQALGIAIPPQFAAQVTEWVD
jgi:putative ABC transport system substrate-binding protein